MVTAADVNNDPCSVHTVSEKRACTKASVRVQQQACMHDSKRACTTASVHAQQQEACMHIPHHEVMESTVYPMANMIVSEILTHIHKALHKHTHTKIE